MFSTKKTARIAAGRRSFSVSQFDSDYTGFHLVIYMHESGPSQCTISGYGEQVQKQVNESLQARGWGCRRLIVPKLAGEFEDCPFRLAVIRLTTLHDPVKLRAAATRNEIIAAYSTAIEVKDMY